MVNKFIKLFNMLLIFLLSNEIFIKSFGGIWKIKERANKIKKQGYSQYLY